LGTVVAKVLTTYNDVNGPLYAKGLGFSFVVGGMSLLFVALSVGAYLFHASLPLQRTVSEELLGFLPPDIGPRIIDAILDLATRWGSLSIITFGVFVFTSFALFDSLERTLSMMLPAPRRRFLVGRGVSLALLGVTVIFFYITAALSVTANYFSVAFRLPAFSVYVSVKAVSLLLTTAVFYVLFRLFARRRLRFWNTVVVAGIAALCWLIVGSVGAVLIRFAGHRFLIYGAVAWAVMIMIYVRVLGEIIVVSGIAVGVLNPTTSPEKQSA
jgi:membrane protein